MSERLFMGNDNGAFKLRVAKPGFDARNAAIENCLLHENMRPMSYLAQGYVTVAGGGSASVALGMAFSFPPVVILRCASNRMHGCEAELNLSTGILTVTSYLGYTDTFKYVVFIA
ncbi:hypothetical protein REJC140_00098 [Pseudorhizobium endolithicum]|uniref:Uncharacterized protein n=1 Tax=Pseudorhizobium endolithicum TaxID=1191678 RepID=A0ABM8PCG9_9HYPH|nr:hypothetical protein [Pseudorhizobium endolithicum]CAD7023115.1 hypothetical protein REJC140_00098 [Pseudorhizobium endolithicum]